MAGTKSRRTTQSSAPSRKRVRTIREGFNYQDHLGAIILLDALRERRKIAIRLESSDGSHVDDVVVERPAEVDYYQVKWAARPGAYYSFVTLTERRTPRSTSLLGKFAKSWRHLRGGEKPFYLHLYSNRAASTADDDLASALRPDGTLSEEFFTGDRFATARDAWREHTRLSAVQFAEFARTLRFDLNRPNEEEIGGQLRLRLDALGLAHDLIGRLLRLVQHWSVERFEPLDRHTILDALGLDTGRVDPLAVDPPERHEATVPDPDLGDVLDARLERLRGGYIVLHGPPGSGKTTALMLYAEGHADGRGLAVAQYYCFHPRDPYPARRLTGSTFLQSLVTSLQERFPQLFTDQRPFDHTGGRLDAMLQTVGRHASELGKVAVVTIDGLDHAWRGGTAQDSVFDALPTTPPDNVVFLVSVQTPDQLPERLRPPRSETERYLPIDRFDLWRTHDYVALRLEAAGAVDDGQDLLRPGGVAALRQRADGLPLYLHYLVDLWLRERPVDLIRFLEQFPRVDGDITRYYAALLPRLESINAYILRALGAFSFAVTPEQVAGILGESRVDRFAVRDALARVGHLLDWGADGRVAIFHESFRAFLLDDAPAIADEVRGKIYAQLRADLGSEAARAHLFEYAVAAGDLQTPIRMCDQPWLERQLGDRQPPEAIRVNVHYAIDAAATARDLVALVRLGLVAFQLAQAEWALEREDAQGALLRMGEDAAATRYSWDGHDLNGSPPSAFHLAFALGCRGQEALGIAILRAGYDAWSADDTRVWQDANTAYYRAASLYTRDLAALWRHVADNRPLDERLPEWQQTDHTTTIIEALVAVGRGDALETLAGTEKTPELRARLRVAAAQVRVASGGTEAARALLDAVARDAAERAAMAGNSAASLAVRLDLGVGLVSALSTADPLTIPTEEELDRYRSEWRYEGFAEQVRAYAYLGRSSELAILDRGLTDTDTLPTQHLRLILAASRVADPEADAEALLADVQRRLADLDAAIQRGAGGERWFTRQAIPRHLIHLLPNLARDVSRRWPEIAPRLLTALHAGVLEGNTDGIREALIEAASELPGCAGACRELLAQAERALAATVLGARERASGFFRLAGLAATLDDPSLADALFRLGTRALLGHGDRKDVQLHQLIDAAELLAPLDPSGSFARLAAVGEWVEWMQDVTDGKETHHLPNILTAAVTELDPVAGMRLTTQYMGTNNWFDWVPAGRAIAKVIATRDTEGGWALATVGIDDDYEADGAQVRGRIDVIRVVASVGRRDEARALASEAATFAARVLPPTKAAAAGVAIAMALRGRDVGRAWMRAGESGGPSWAGNENSPEGATGGSAAEATQILQWLRDPAGEAERAEQAVEGGDWFAESGAQETELRRLIAVADSEQLIALGAEYRSRRHPFAHGILLAIARRFQALGAADRFLEWARLAHAEANAWSDPFWGGSLEPFLALAAVDRRLAEDLLFSSLAETYKRGPIAAPASLARLFAALPALGGGPYVALWDVASAHASSLFAHLPTRPALFAWLATCQPAEPTARLPATVAFIADRLSWPELAVREQALAALVRLVERRASVAAPILSARLASSNLALASLSAAVLHAASLTVPGLLAPEAGKLRRAVDSGHLLIADSAAQTLEGIARAGATEARDAGVQAASVRLRGLSVLAVPPPDSPQPITRDEMARLQYWRPA